MIKLVGFSLLSFFLIAGCAQQPVEPVVTTELQDVTETKQQAIENALKQQSEKANASLAKANQKGNKSTPLKKEKRFDMAANELPAQLFFTQLMTHVHDNIVIHPDVNGLISLNLKQITMSELLDVVRDIYGYDYEYSRGIYKIYANKLRTEIFPIDYINVRRVGVSDTSVLTGNIESSTQSTASQDDSETADLVGSGNSIAPGSRIQTRSETDFWFYLQQSISEITGADREEDGNDRKVIINPQTGMVVVTAMPSELAAVRKFLQKAQLTIKKQVIIEAKILEIELSEDYQAGINWDEINGELLLANNVAEFVSPNSITAVSEAPGEIFSSLIKVPDISRLLSLLQTQGNVQVLSSPRVATVNNQKAVIRVGSDRFFVTGITNTTTTSSGSTTNNPDVELSSFFSGISLDVTPQIDSDNNVTLHIHPVISSVTEEQKEILVGDSALSVPLALRDIRESDSIVRAANGEVIVLGGLMQERSASANGKRPVLGDVPVVGGLFRTNGRSQVKSELIILLKPIVAEESSWYDAVADSRERIDSWSANKDTAVQQ